MDAEDLEKRWKQKSQEAFQTIARWRQDHPKAPMAEIETLIDQQLDQLNISAKMLDEINGSTASMKDKSDGRRSFFESLISCQGYLREALLQFRVVDQAKGLLW